MTCPLCASGRLRVLGRHIEFSEHGERDLGPCEAAEEPVKPREFPFRERLAAWVERMNRDCHKAIPLPKTTDVPPPRCEPEGDREP